MAALFIVTTLVGWGLTRAIDIPTWLVILVLGPQVFALLGDIINLIYCDWKLRKLTSVR